MDNETKATTDLENLPDKEAAEGVEKVAPLRAEVGGRRIAISRLGPAIKACVLSGTNRLQQSISREQMIIDDTWIINIEDCIHSVENIVRNPKTFIKDERELVAMERARTADREAVRHLSTHSEHVRKIQDDGMVIPKKVLTRNRLEDYAIYENRVTYTLIRNLKLFIEERYTAIKELIKFYELTELKMESKFDFGKAQIEYDLNMRVSQRMADADKCQELLERLERVRKRVQIMDNSPFAKELKGSKPVRPPLQRTNLLTKNVDYRNVYNLWLFISSFKELGYEVRVANKLTPFDDIYTDDLTKLVVDSVKVMIRNNTINRDQYQATPFKHKRPKKFKMLKKVEPKLVPNHGDILPTDRGINQFYHDRIKELFDKELRDREKNKEKEAQTIDSVFKRFTKSLTRINRIILEDIVRDQSKKKAARRMPGAKRNAIDSAKLRVKEAEEAEKSYEILLKLKEEEFAALKKKKKAVSDNRIKQKKLLDQKILKAKQDAERKELEKKKAAEKKVIEKQKALERKLALKKKNDEKKAKERLKAQERRAKERERLKAQKEREKQAIKNKNKPAAKKTSVKPATKEPQDNIKTEQ